MAYWWLNQKEDDYALLDEQDLIAIPRRDKLGRTNPSYPLAAEMRPGDIGFVFVNGELDGVFTVTAPPEDDAIEMAPDFQRRPTRLAQVRFFGLAAPVRFEETSLRLRDALPAVESPLDPEAAGKDTRLHRVVEPLAERLIAMAADAEPMAASIGEALAEAISHSDLPEDTKTALIEARLGVGRFGDDVRNLWGGCCCATGATVEMLVSVHPIKPWVRASNDERLDPENGLPMLATWSLAFLSGLIAFDDDGAILLAADLPADEARKAGIDPGFRLPIKGERQRFYLAWHRTHLFAGG
ncbi:MAG TPA: hypothetical protein VJ890_09965 [Vineibacter sp.]|nr:hypothetical protein [Vineibacter sp.]